MPLRVASWWEAEGEKILEKEKLLERREMDWPDRLGPGLFSYTG